MNVEREAKPGTPSTQAAGLLSFDLSDIGPEGWGHLLLAGQLLLRGEYQRALSEIEAATAVQPDLAAAHFLRGLIYGRTAEWDKARESLQTATVHDPHHVNSWCVLAYVEVERGCPHEALKALDEALRLEPANANAHLLRGDILRSLDRFDEAANAYRSSAGHNPQSHVAKLKLARVLEQLGRTEEAIEMMISAQRLNPLDIQSRLALGNILVARGAFDEAIREFKSAADLEPGNADVQGRLGRIYLQQGRHTEAMISLKLATTLNPRDVEGILNLARLYLQLNRVPEAVDLVNTALEIDPQYPPARELLETARAADERGGEALDEPGTDAPS